MKNYVVIFFFFLLYLNVDGYVRGRGRIKLTVLCGPVYSRTLVVFTAVSRIVFVHSPVSTKRVERALKA